MPTISMFFGIVIRMYNNGREHNPPNFHAEYQGQNACFDMDGNVIEGDLPAKQKKLIAAWTEIHREELLANWGLCMEQEPLYKIDPLR